MTGEVLPYNKSLDGLRALAVLLVLFAHFPAVEGVGPTFFLKAAASGLRVGYLGVDIFFVLSGFLITSILAREKKLGILSFARFYKKRALRIFPIFYLSLVFVFLVLDIPVSEFIANAFYVSNYFYSFDAEPSPLRHTWSLSVEEQFYLFWPLVLAYCPFAKINRVIVLGLIFVIAATAMIAASTLEFDSFHRLSVRALPFRMLSLGVGAYIALNPGVARAVPIRYSIYTILVCPVLILLMYGNDGYVTSLLQLMVMSLWSVSIFLFVLNGANNGISVIAAIFENRAAVYIGRISYGIYLYHYIILFAMGILAEHASVGAAPAMVLMGLVLTFAVASFSFYVIERPFLRMKSRLAGAPV